MDVNNTMTPLPPGGPLRPAALRHDLCGAHACTAAALRRGLIGMVDLEQYDYEPGSAAADPGHGGHRSLPHPAPGGRAEERPHRAAPRHAARATIARRTVIEPLGGETADMERLYDFELMENGGHITGWRLTDAQLGRVARRPVGPGRPRRLQRPLPHGGPARHALRRGGRQPLPGHRQGVLRAAEAPRPRRRSGRSLPARYRPGASW